MMMSLTSEVTTVPRAPPMITPIARASAFVFSRNARNSPSMAGSSCGGWAGGEPRACRPIVSGSSVADDLREARSLLDPARDRLLGRHLADRVRAGRVELLECRREVRGITPGELCRRIDAGGLEEVGIFGADAADPHQIGMVDPF